MRKLAITTLTAALCLTLAARPADASRCGPDCLPWLNPVAYALGAGLVGGYAYGTGYFIVRDLDDTEKSTNYYGSELIAHGSLGSIVLGATITAARDGQVGTTVVAGSFAAMHLTLATNGLRGLVRKRGQFRPNDTLVTWTVGSVTGINAMYWAAGMSEPRSRSYGIAEMAINAPFVAGFGYLAKDRFESGATGPGLAYAGIAAIHGLYIAHGAKTALGFRSAPKLGVLGTDVTPTVVSDGRQLVPGLATAGTF